MLGSFILCNQDLIAVWNILDIKVFENFGNDILLNSSEFILDYIKKNDKSINININYKNLLYEDSKCNCKNIDDYNKKNILIINESDFGCVFGGYAQKGFEFDSSKKRIIKVFYFLLIYPKYTL